MRLSLRCSLLVLASLSMTVLVSAQEARLNTPSGDPPASVNAAPKADDKTTATVTAPAIADPLLRVLFAKGLITAEEARAVGGSGTSLDQRDRLAALLRDKGLLSAAEFDAIRSTALTATAQPVLASVQQQQPPQGQGQPGQQKPQGPATAPSPAAGPTVIAAVAPIRALQLEAAKRDGLIPDIKLGSGAKLKLYGFFKASVVHDTSSPGGNDFPLPGFLGDTGPEGSPEFHIKARALRIGANFEWLDPSPKFSVTGRLEFDFEGNFTRVNNRNISSIRSSQPSLRLAWMRIDRQLNEKTTGFALFGQDWTPFGSSTLPNLLETTGLGIGFGSLYERLPQVRTGLNFNAGGKRALKFQPEFAIVLPAFGNVPSDTGNQLGFGERQGADSQRPEIQARFVTQFQLDRAPGVVPAQLIISFMQGERKAIVTAANVPLVPGATGAAASAFRQAFPSGAEVESDRYGYTAEIQLPTRFVTIVGKYYRGEDLRFYFAGQLFSTFNDTAGLTGVATAPSIDGSSTVAFGFNNGVAAIAPQRSVRSQGGFINLGFPLSRIFGADPKGRNAGWTGYLHYGYDDAKARDARRFGGRGRSDLFAGTLFYRLNAFVTLAYEQSLYRTRAANASRFAQGGLPLFRGIPSRETHNIRSEFATIFTF